jgi:predicted GTPase
MLEFIQLLKQRYQLILQGGFVEDSVSEIYQDRVDSLNLAEAFLKKGLLISEQKQHPVQVAVIGPTQAGKSSVVNLLLDNGAAGVSALAGYTVHPQGFAVDLKNHDFSWLEQYFSGFKKVEQSQLVNEDHNSFSLTNVDSKTLPASVLWDTADFDSIGAAGYRKGVLKTIALADVVVLVVSKEKYADQSVWEVMNLIESLNQPTLIIVNKLIEDSQDIILRSLEEKWQQARKDDFPETIIPLHYQKQGVPSVQQLDRPLINRMFGKHNRNKQPDNQIQFLNQHWSAWTEPMVAEFAVVKEWQEIIDLCTKDALKNYQRDYLNHPNHYETFQNALANLLTLLELPGIAKVMAKTRRVLTWPVRTLFGIKTGRRRQLAEDSHEVAVLNQIAEHALIQLAENILDKADKEQEKRQWWKEINLILRQQREQILENFKVSVNQYHGDFQEEVEATAQRLYNKLDDQPVLLNGLRATRVTTDAAALALALYTGGIGLHDLIITPAMLSITSLLAESTLGGYMNRLEAELKQTQLNTVKQRLFIEVLQQTLGQFPELMSKGHYFNISQSQLEQAEQQLKQKPHGLRLF